MDKHAVIKTSEGKYVLHSERLSGTVQFMHRRGTRLTVASLHGGNEEGMYMIFNVGDYLNICPFDSTDRVSTVTSSFTCHVALKAPAQCGLPPGACSDAVASFKLGRVFWFMLCWHQASCGFSCCMQEPIRSMIFNPSAVRDGYPCTHAFTNTTHGVDLVVGIANGEGTTQVLLQSPIWAGCLLPHMPLYAPGVRVLHLGTVLQAVISCMSCWME